jgi:predicted secreted protein
MTRWITLVALVLALSQAAFAGDVATLVNLGFSPDSTCFMFGFYGLDTSPGKPYAELYLVDTKKNEFRPGGVFKGMYGAELKPGWDPAGGFYKLFSDAAPLARKNRIDHLAQGRLVYLLINGAEGPDTLAFKDFETAAQWNVALKETVEEKAGALTSSFSLDVSVTNGERKSVVKAGNPAIKRKGVANYTIREIVVAPDDKTVVVLIERLEKGASGNSIRYMVETFRLP